ncbi:MAG: LON peptidase substrate-binding domain-containing protein [Bacteroidetes bacterium]|nr:LON peptidase substrate-binding domain-containing protein [Bacteroidota bacterium]
MVRNRFTLPIFPLNVVVIPGETRSLRVYTECCRELIADCLANQASFGIAYMKEGVLSHHGVEVSICRIIHLPDGELEVEVKGIQSFKILQYTKVLKPKLYGAASIELYEDENISSRYKLFRSFKKFIKQIKQQEIPVEALTNTSIYKVANLLDLTNEEKLQLISLDTLKEKEDFLIAKIKLYSHTLKLEKELRSNFKFN